MGTTFVSVDKHGFWMQDTVLELWLRLLALHLEDSPDSDSPVHEIRTKWLLASRGGFIGWVPHGIEEAIATPKGRETVLNAIELLRCALEQAPPHLNKDVLNLLGFELVTFTEDFETRRLLDVADGFTDLIHGRISSDASDTSYMPGNQ